MKNREIVDQLLDVPLFCRCERADLRSVARHIELVSVPAGKPIVEQDAPGDAFFLLLEGSTTVERDGVVIRRLGPGDHFGELALLDPAPRSASVLALTDCRLAMLGRRMFAVILREVPQISSELLASLAGMVRESRPIVDVENDGGPA
jgi:CRP-like cAMP-binding protein